MSACSAPRTLIGWGGRATANEKRGGVSRPLPIAESKEMRKAIVVLSFSKSKAKQSRKGKDRLVDPHAEKEKREERRENV